MQVPQYSQHPDVLLLTRGPWFSARSPLCFCFDKVVTTYSLIQQGNIWNLSLNQQSNSVFLVIRTKQRYFAFSYSWSKTYTNTKPICSNWLVLYPTFSKSRQLFNCFPLERVCLSVLQHSKYQARSIMTHFWNPKSKMSVMSCDFYDSLKWPQHPTVTLHSHKEQVAKRRSDEMNYF